VQVGDAATLVGHQLYPGDVPDQHRGAALGAQHEALDVCDAAQVAAPAHHVLGLAHLDHAAANVPVAIGDHFGDTRNRNVELSQADRIDGHRVLAHEATDAGDLGDARGGGQLVSQVPILHGAQFVQR